MSIRILRISAVVLSLFSATAPVVARDADDLTVAEERTAPQPSAVPCEGGLRLTAPQGAPLTFHIFSITGQLVKSATLSEEIVCIELPRGCSVVKCGRWSKKVMVQ